VLQRLRIPDQTQDRSEKFSVFWAKISGCLVKAVLLAAFTGCVDGPLFALKKANPYYRSQWKEDSEKGIVFSERQAEVRLLRSQISGMTSDEQMLWVSKLAQVYDYETSPELRRDAVLALGATQHPDAEAPLIRACSDKNDKVRMAACKAMAGRDSAASSQMLASVAQSDKNMSVRLAAIRSLGTYQSDDAKAVLRKSLDEKSPALQYEATVALKEMTGRDFGGNVENWRQFMDGQTVEERTMTLAERLSSSLLLK
jgi:hypothetical protein